MWGGMRFMLCKMESLMAWSSSLGRQVSITKRYMLGGMFWLGVVGRRYSIVEYSGINSGGRVLSEMLSAYSLGNLFPVLQMGQYQAFAL